jgi:hypothetical protein
MLYNKMKKQKKNNRSIQFKQLKKAQRLWLIPKQLNSELAIKIRRMRMSNIIFYKKCNKILPS